jgi:CRISPR-associated protein Cmr4
MNESFKCFQHVGLAVDPIHIGTGGARLGRVDLSIVRDPVTKVPKIPGSSLAGVYRTYVAMYRETSTPNRQINGKAKPYYPDCAGLGQMDAIGAGGHCGQPDCHICTVFGFARGKDSSGGFAGLAAFSDAHVLLFPVATREGPLWVTSPEQLRVARLPDAQNMKTDTDALYRANDSNHPLNLGWLLLTVKKLSNYSSLKSDLTKRGVLDYILDRFGVVPDRLFSHVVNSNLEVRTSVSINPETGAAEEHALFTYEALPRATVLYWEVTCKNPNHFRINNQGVSAVQDPDAVHNVVTEVHSYLECLGIGGMGTRGMGRLRVLSCGEHYSPSVQDAEAAGAPPASANIP